MNNNLQNMFDDKKTVLNRINYIGTLRGLACLAVYLNHVICIFAPGLMWYSKAYNELERVWLGTPLNVITNGNSAVQFFFVISGYLISNKIFKNSTYEITVIGILKKIKKLLLVIIPPIILAFFLMKCNRMYHLVAAKEDPILGFVLDYNNFQPTILSLLIDIKNTFFIGSIYVGPLWFISIEFIGGIMVEFIAVAMNQKRELVSGVMIYIFVWILLLQRNQNLCSFVVGSFAAYILNYKQYNYCRLKNRGLKITLFIIGIYFFTVQNDTIGIYKVMASLKAYLPSIRSIGMGMLLVGTECCSELKDKISNMKVLRFFGNYSAYIYGFHWPILLSLGCWIYLEIGALNIDRNFKILIVASVCMMVTIVFSAILVKIYSLCGHICKKYVSNYNLL